MLKNMSEWRKEERRQVTAGHRASAASPKRPPPSMGPSLSRCWSLLDIHMLSENYANSECATWLPDICLHSAMLSRVSRQRRATRVQVNEGGVAIDSVLHRHL